MPAIKRYTGKRTKLKGFLTQINLKIQYKGDKLLLAADRVIYAGIYLLGRVLE